MPGANPTKAVTSICWWLFRSRQNPPIVGPAPGIAACSVWLELQAHVGTGQVELIWSYVLDYENAQNPFAERRESIARWRSLAVHRVQETEATRLLARQLVDAGIKPYDALHVACAVAGEATLFVSTDDALLKRLKASSSIKAALPAEALAIVENWYED